MLLECVAVECPTNIFGRKGYFYILSDNQTNANNAQTICMNAGGRLADVRDGTIQEDFMEYAIRRLIDSIIGITSTLLKIIE